MATTSDPTLRLRQRDRKRRGHRRRSFLGLAGCMIVGAGAFCITQAPPSLSLSKLLDSPTPVGPKAYTNLSLIGKAAVVYDLTNGQTLYAENADTPLPLASITKLLTVYAAAHVLKPDSAVAITPHALAQYGDEADRIFYAGETFRFDDIARLTLAASSNIGAEAIADAADSAENTETAPLLSAAARKAGLAQTRASNASGLDISATASGSYGSAHDVAVLAGELLKKDPQIAAATTQPEVGITSLEGTRHRFDNTDTYFTRYPGLLLSKTGYTALAGGNLVIVDDAGAHHPVAIVVLGSTKDGRFTDVSQLKAATRAYFEGHERRRPPGGPRRTAPARRPAPPTSRRSRRSAECRT